MLYDGNLLVLLLCQIFRSLLWWCPRRRTLALSSSLYDASQTVLQITSLNQTCNTMYLIKSWTTSYNLFTVSIVLLVSPFFELICLLFFLFVLTFFQFLYLYTWHFYISGFLENVLYREVASNEPVIGKVYFHVHIVSFQLNYSYIRGVLRNIFKLFQMFKSLLN